LHWLEIDPNEREIRKLDAKGKELSAVPGEFGVPGDNYAP
jgi:hypothetical protein